MIMKQYPAMKGCKICEEYVKEKKNMDKNTRKNKWERRSLAMIVGGGLLFLNTLFNGRHIFLPKEPLIPNRSKINYSQTYNEFVNVKNNGLVFAGFAGMGLVFMGLKKRFEYEIDTTLFMYPHKHKI